MLGTEVEERGNAGYRSGGKRERWVKTGKEERGNAG